MTPKVTAILSLYKRPESLEYYINRIREQSEPCDIWLDWTVCDENRHIDIKSLGDDIKVTKRENHNLFVRGRFFHALNAKTPYVFIVDDDMFPQPDYVASCVRTLETENKESVIVGWGSRFKKDSSNYNKEGGQYGWAYPNQTIKQVDWGGHSWFFPIDCLKLFVSEDMLFPNNGEDLHLCYTSSMLGDYKILVLPHKHSNKKEWSTDYDLTKAVSAKNALHKRGNHSSQRHNIVEHYRKKGWEPILNHSDEIIYK